MSLKTVAYFNDVKLALDSVEQKWIEDTARAIKDAPIILTGGNGGSAAIAIHFAADLRSLGYKVFDMCGPSKLTQIGNDEGFQNVFANQVRLHPDALVILFSGSGTSENIARVFYAHKNAILFTSTMKNIQAFAVGAYRVRSDDYEVIEDAHSAICHAIKKELRA